MNIEKTKGWLIREKNFLKVAIRHGEGEGSLADWKEQLEVVETCLEAIEQMEKLTTEVERWKSMYQAAAEERNANTKRLIELELKLKEVK